MNSGQKANKKIMKTEPNDGFPSEQPKLTPAHEHADGAEIEQKEVPTQAKSLGTWPPECRESFGGG
jgi:hypothetical protein